MIIYTLPENRVLEPVVRDGKDRFCAVFLSSEKSDQLQNFRCTSCGWVVCQYSNKSVEAVVYGQSVPEESNSLDVQCSRCKRIYRIV